MPSVENKGEWIPFSEELPPKGKKVYVSTFGIVTIGERTSDTVKVIIEIPKKTYKTITTDKHAIYDKVYYSNKERHST